MFRFSALFKKQMWNFGIASTPHESNSSKETLIKWDYTNAGRWDATKPSRELDESKPQAQLESSRRSVLKLGKPQANLAIGRVPQTAQQSRTFEDIV